MEYDLNKEFDLKSANIKIENVFQNYNKLKFNTYYQMKMIGFTWNCFRFISIFSCKILYYFISLFFLNFFFYFLLIFLINFLI